MAPKHEFEHEVKMDVEARVCQGVKAVPEEILEEEMTEHLEAGYPGSHHARLRTTNMLERLFEEVKRRTRVVQVFLNEVSVSTLATEIALRSSEQWALKRCLTGGTRETWRTKPTTFEALTRFFCPSADVLLIDSYRPSRL